MDFQLTPEQSQLQREVRDFAEREIRPHVLEWDEAQTFPRETIRQLGQLGVLGAMLPEDVGGAGFGYQEFAIIIEEIARVDPSVALIVAAQSSLCASHIDHHANDEQRQKYLPNLASGEWVGCWSLTEPGSGSDAAAARTQGVIDGGEWVLNGEKTFATNASQADVFVIMANTEGDAAKSSRRLSAFLVEKGTPGLTIGPKENKLGMRASETCSIHLSDCRLPAAALIGERGEGFIQTLQNLTRGRVTVAALSVGIAQGAFDAALAYSQQRKQFGKTISEFQAVRQMLADMATGIQASRLLTYQAAWYIDNGRANAKLSAMAKLHASETGVRITNDALQIHGGYGFIKDYGVEKFYRDVKLMTIGEGTSEIQRMIIARELLRK